jgi:hypothetical protein
MKTKLTRLLSALLLPPLAALAIGEAHAVEFKPFGTSVLAIDLHGFASQGFIATNKYNYLGKSSEGSFRFSEAGLNLSFNPFPRTRVSAQVFTYDVGDAGEYDVVLDYAHVEYKFDDEIGVRVGRIRRPEGIYNDIQDLDLSRTWVLLPQGIYNARWRDFYLALDGGEIFGTIPLSLAGSLTYDFYYGIQHPKLNGGLALQKANLPPFQPLVDINAPQMGGGQLWWNTPVKGLRAGAALNYDRDLTFATDTGRQSKGSPFTQHYSLEYLWNSWTFQAEYLRFRIDYENTAGGLPPSTRLIEPDSWYVSAAYRFNKWVELGSYYSEYYPNVHDRKGATLPFASDAYQKDTAVALRFDVNDSVIFKVEGHYIRGTGQLFDNVENPIRQDDGWWMIALKTTLSF